MKKYDVKSALAVVAGSVEAKGNKVLKVVGETGLTVLGALDYLQNYGGYTVVFPLTK